MSWFEVYLTYAYSLSFQFEPESPDKSSSSSPRTSSSSSTPQTSVGDKKKAISFDPIVKEYSHITEQGNILVYRAPEILLKDIIRTFMNELYYKNIG